MDTSETPGTPQALGAPCDPFPLAALRTYPTELSSTPVSLAAPGNREVELPGFGLPPASELSVERVISSPDTDGLL